MSEPTITAQSLVHYMETRRPAQRAQILRDHRNGLGKAAFAPCYQPAMVAIRGHHRGRERALDAALETLQRSLHEAEVRLRRALPEDDVAP